MRSATCLLAVAGLSLLGRAVVPAAAQDANYWTIQYGPVAQLLGGQVVGSTRDLSATYYNPGGLALAKQPAFLLSVQSVLLQGVKVTPSEGPLTPASNWTMGVTPSLVAGAFPQSWFGDKTRLAWSILTRKQLDMSMDQPFAGTVAGSETAYGAEMLSDQSVTETWGGLTLSHRMGDSWGLGATLYGAYQGQQTRLEESAQLGGSSGLAALGIENINYYHWRTLAKVGVAWDPHRTLQLGLAVTTPSLGLFGGGKAAYTQSLVGLDVDGTPVSSLVNGVDDNAKADYRSSWAIAGGAAWRVGQTNLNVSGEWFAPVSRYAVLTAPANEGTPLAQVYQQLKGVFNAGMSVEHKFGGGTNLYAAFATDYNAAVETPGMQLNVSTWNLYHLTAGTSLKVIGSRVTLGGSYAFGSSTRKVGFGSFPPETPVLGQPPSADVRYNRLTLVLGFVLGG